jgi:hypothetical protein
MDPPAVDVRFDAECMNGQVINFFTIINNPGYCWSMVRELQFEQITDKKCIDVMAR